jgi:hypothetical protein
MAGAADGRAVGGGAGALAGSAAVVNGKAGSVSAAGGATELAALCAPGWLQLARTRLPRAAVRASVEAVSLKVLGERVMAGEFLKLRGSSERP